MAFYRSYFKEQQVVPKGTQMLGLSRIASLAALDPDAAAYVSAVEAVDQAKLEATVVKAIHDFVTGCKSDGIWSAITASCILAGARTLAGALVPLKGPAPTNTNFVQADYSRTLGLQGDGTSKHLNTNRGGDADGTSNCHIAIAGRYPDTGTSTGIPFMGNAFNGGAGGRGIQISFGTGATSSYTFKLSGTHQYTNAIKFPSTLTMAGASRANNTSASILLPSGIATSSSSFASGNNNTVFVFWDGTSSNRLHGRTMFYSLGNNINLTLLNSRVIALGNALALSLPY